LLGRSDQGDTNRESKSFMKTNIAKQEFCVWAHFDKKSSLDLNSIKNSANKKLSGPQFELHLTLFSQIESIDEKTDEFLSRTSDYNAPFVITTDEIQIKNKFFQALFVKIKNENHLMKFRKQIAKGLNLESELFFPHVSLYYGKESEENKNKVKKELSQPPKELLIDRITLVDTSKEIESWSVLKSYPLNGI